jgi:gliding motility-associated-like protein
LPAADFTVFFQANFNVATGTADIARLQLILSISMKPGRYTYLLLLLLCLFTCNMATSQGVCTSSALAPVFRQTFDSAASSGSKGLVPTGFVTNYAYQNKTSLSDGEYIVTPLVQNSQKADWAVGGDHTGNTNGNMFLVNAGTGASLFFYQQVDNLCPGSVYSFSAWLLNANTITKTLPICGAGYVYPKVTFNIKNLSGTVLASYTTDTLPLTKSTSVAPNWRQYGFQFALPAGTTSLILEMVDYYGGKPQCGNDLAIDDILFSACTPTATATLSTASSICAGTSTSISCSLVNSPFSNPAYQWQKSTDGGSTWSNIATAGTSMNSYTIPKASAGDNGNYRVIVGPDIASLSSSSCITSSNTISLTVHALPLLDMGGPLTSCTGNSISISPAVTGGATPYSYSWTGPGNYISATAMVALGTVSTVHAGTYHLTVSDKNGCMVSDSQTLTTPVTPVVSNIAGADAACIGSVIALSNTTTGGAWSSSNNTVASVSQTGIVSVIQGGNATITYTVTANGCSASVIKLVYGTGVQLKADIISCNNSSTRFAAADPEYGVSYYNNQGGTYQWQITGGTVQYLNGTDASAAYPEIQLAAGNTYRVLIQYNNYGVGCSDTQYIYKNISVAASVISVHDTTVCFATGEVPVSGRVSSVTNRYYWSTSGKGSFYDTGSLSTRYIPDSSDKAHGIVVLYLHGSSSISITGSCGSSTAIDSIILRFQSANTGAAVQKTICSGDSLQFTPASSVAGSRFSWTAAVIDGSVSLPAQIGSENITGRLTNLSHISTARVQYSITPSAGGCTGTPFTLTVSVLPQPTITILNKNSRICSGTETAIGLISSIPSTVFSWTQSQASAVKNNQINGDTIFIREILQSQPEQSLKWYHFMATSPEGCRTKDSTAVRVDAVSVAGILTGDTMVCVSGNQGIVHLTGGNGKVQYWESSSDSGKQWTRLDDTLTDLRFKNLTRTTEFRAVMQHGVCPAVKTEPVTVGIVQTPSAAVTGRSQLICDTATVVQLRADLPVSGKGIWALHNGDNNVQILQPDAAITAVKGLKPGKYLFGWTVSNDVCPASKDSVQITVDHIKADFSIHAFYTCGQTMFSFLDSSQSFWGINNRRWSAGAGDTLSTKDFRAAYSKTGDATIWMEVTGNSGCKRTTEASFHTPVYEFPKVDINAIGDACKEQLLKLNSQINSRDSIAYLLWNLGNGIKTSNSAVQVQYFSEGIYTVKLFASTINQCFDSALKAITVHPVPAVNIRNSEIVCSGQTAELKAEGAVSYIWKDSTDQIICDNCATLKVRPTSNARYKVIGYSAYGCSNISTAQVKVIPPFRLMADISDTICRGQQIRLNVSGAARYQWRNDPGLSNYHISNPVAQPASSTVYRVIASDNYQCFTDSADVRVTVGDPTPIHIRHDSAVLAGSAVELKAVSSIPNIKKWEWKGPATFSCLNCVATKATVRDDATLQCTATNIYGCSSTDTVTIRTFCPGTEVFIPNAFTPDGDGINDILYVQGRGLRIIKSFRIYSRWGELVFEKMNFMPGDKMMGWDGRIRGKKANPDVFVYVCEAVCEKGTAQLFKGNTAILQ